ncbi:hypothetical protein BDA96_05G032900 [Sorghum bicolor]|uniref:Uncharacterized protein n=1 Tax=Sorghum bicolor TaxID=4558 RepID=A0A921QX46_SORBI|nr:hypothetical protein BDA96_05G032900 [Sorghum bicolor]
MNDGPNGNLPPLVDRLRTWMAAGGASAPRLAWGWDGTRTAARDQHRQRRRSSIGEAFYCQCDGRCGANRDKFCVVHMPLHVLTLLQSQIWMEEARHNQIRRKLR